MARVLVTSAGYLGDVLPFVSVAREPARGRRDRPRRPVGFPRVARGRAGHAASSRRGVLASGALRRPPRQVGPVRQRLGAARMTRWMVRDGVIDHVDSVYDSLATIADDADLVFTHNVIVPARWMAERHDIPCVTFPYVPTLVPSDATPPRDAAHAGISGSGGRQTNRVRVGWRDAHHGTRLRCGCSAAE